jgi:hypothetical protein
LALSKGHACCGAFRKYIGAFRECASGAPSAEWGKTSGTGDAHMTQATQAVSFIDDSSARARTLAGRAYAAKGATSPLGPFSFARRAPRAQDVQIEILYCGVCHSDLHQTRDEWKSVMPTVYPCVPGHEIVGRVVKVGSAVKKFEEGDLAAVGCMVDSCGACSACQAGEQQYCLNFATYTYNAPPAV